jgi:hypothetical protein
MITFLTESNKQVDYRTNRLQAYLQNNNMVWMYWSYDYFSYSSFFVFVLTIW